MTVRRAWPAAVLLAAVTGCGHRRAGQVAQAGTRAGPPPQAGAAPTTPHPAAALPRPGPTAEQRQAVGALEQRGGILMMQGQFLQSAAVLKDALVMADAQLGAGDPQTLRVAVALGEARARSGDYAGAVTLIQRGLAGGERLAGPYAPALLPLYEMLAPLLQARGRFDEAESMMRGVLAARTRAGHLGRQALLNVLFLAGMLRERHELEKEETLLTEQLLRWQEAGPIFRAQAAILQNELGNMYAARGDRASARRAFEAAVAVLAPAEGREAEGAANALTNLGTLLSRENDIQGAEAAFRRSLAVRERLHGPDSLYAAESLSYLGVYLASWGRRRDAGGMLERALAIYEQHFGPQHPLVGRGLCQLARSTLDSGEGAKAAIPLFQRAIAIFEKTGSVQRLVPALLDLGIALAATGDLAAAEAAHRRAVEAAETSLGASHTLTHRALGLLARTYAAEGRALDSARTAAIWADRREQVLSVVLASGNSRQRRALLRNGSYGADLDEAVALHLQRAPADPAAARIALDMILRRKGRLLEAEVEGTRAVRAGAAAEDQARLDELARKRQALAGLVFQPLGKDQAAVDRGAALAELTAEVDDIEHRLGRRSAALRVDAQAPTGKAVAAALPPRSALLELVAYRPDAADVRRGGPRGEPRYAAYLLRPDGAIRAADLGPAQTIDALVSRTRAAFAAKAPNWRAAAERLGAALIDPLQADLSDVEQLLVSPDGALNLVPFAALVVDGTLMIDRYQISYLSSGRDLLPAGTAMGQRAAPPAVFAAPDFDAVLAPVAQPVKVTAGRRLPRFRPLPALEGEGRAVAATLGATLYLGARAGEAELRALHGPRLLHVATHGFALVDGAPGQPGGARGVELVGIGAEEDVPLVDAAADPGDSMLRVGVALAGANRAQGGAQDGVMTALEFAALDLSGTELVALSACDSGRGQVEAGEGVYGMRRALVMAGARAQLLTLWPVSDDATRALMTDYYGHLVGGGGRAGALRASQLTVRADPRRSHPFYWAAFVLSGAPGPLPGAATPEAARPAP